jgi:hypothetical protein
MLATSAAASIEKLDSKAAFLVEQAKKQVLGSDLPVGRPLGLLAAYLRTRLAPSLSAKSMAVDVFRSWGECSPTL